VWRGIRIVRPRKRRGYHHGDLRRTLLDVSIAVIDRHGVDALNLRELAIRAGVSSGAPYHHFRDREALLAAIAEEGFAVLAAAMIRERDAAADDPTARLAALGRAYLGFATSHRGYFRVMFRGDLISTPELVQAKPLSYHLLWEAIEDCQRSGVAPSGDPQPLVLTAWSVVHGLATLWIDRTLPPKGLDPDHLAPMVTSLLGDMFASLARRHAVRSNRPRPRGARAARRRPQ
jgi:AcrR family transcriptional regulator